MRVPPSTPSDLFRDGASIRIWRDSHSKLKQLAAIRKQSMAVVFDTLVHDALQVVYDAMDVEANTPHPSGE